MNKQMKNPEVRLILSIGLAVLTYLLLPKFLGAEIHLLAGWNLGVLCFLTLIGFTVLNCNHEQTLYHARMREPSSLSILSLVVITACMSIFIIGFMLSDIKTTPQPIRSIQVWSSLLAIICSWLLTHTMFALHYARIYYNEANGKSLEEYTGGLEFPNDELPDYFDFMYFSFTISMTSQTSDVSITSRQIRRIVLGHEIVSFFFYSVILATTVNTLANLI
jgi:uncharacterized membrane protein